ncbi:MAG: UMP kinase, partial [Candidatus Bathyarchaeota archaeon]|nr:UMP kinase [Candidatus Bathyarchaeota archaeon]
QNDCSVRLMKVVVRIGGSVVASPPDPPLIRRYAEIIRKLRAQGHELVVIVGGGTPARQFIQLAKDLGLSEQEQDEAAISVSRLLAQLLAMMLGGLNWKTAPASMSEVSKALQENGTVIMGGLRPGMTTDTVAALVASEVDASLIVKATDQEGIYTKDPKRHPDARKLDELCFNELDRLLEEDRHKAGIHQIIDPEAVRILKEKRIKMVIVNGFKPDNVVAAIRGERIGTTIK